MEQILEKKANYGPKLYGDNVEVEVETVSRQNSFTRNQTAEPEDRLGKYRQNQTVQNTPPAAVQPPQTMRSKQAYNREPYFDEWKCPDCGTINNDYVSTCA